jgi:hypothetical protein
MLRAPSLFFWAVVVVVFLSSCLGFRGCKQGQQPVDGCRAEELRYKHTWEDDGSCETLTGDL